MSVQEALLAATKERDWQSQVVMAAKLWGWRCYWTWNAMHSPKGWPDLVLVRPPRIVHAELKRMKGRLSREQEETLALLRECGAEVYVWRPSDWDDIERTLKP